jgi:hypothetical protein
MLLLPSSPDKVWALRPRGSRSVSIIAQYLRDRTATSIEIINENQGSAWCICLEKVLYLPVPPYGSDGEPIRDPYPSSGSPLDGLPTGRVTRPVGKKGETRRGNPCSVHFPLHGREKFPKMHPHRIPTLTTVNCSLPDDFSAQRIPVGTRDQARVISSSVRCYGSIKVSTLPSG